MQEQQLNIWQLIIEASLPVQLVMLILVVFSVVSWVLIIQRSLILMRTKQSNDVFEEEFWDAKNTVESTYASFKDREGLQGLENMFVLSMEEYGRLKSRYDHDSVMAGVERVMRVAQVREGERLEAYLPFLATVASVSPYIGLFGTVWGIMNAFIGLAGVQQATLNTVAPGIAEALIATAIGLFAAIPALIAYNRFTAQAGALSTATITFSEELSTLLHRQKES